MNFKPKATLHRAGWDTGMHTAAYGNGRQIPRYRIWRGLPGRGCVNEAPTIALLGQNSANRVGSICVDKPCQGVAMKAGDSADSLIGLTHKKRIVGWTCRDNGRFRRTAAALTIWSLEWAYKTSSLCGLSLERKVPGGWPDLLFSLICRCGGSVVVCLLVDLKRGKDTLVSKPACTGKDWPIQTGQLPPPPGGWRAAGCCPATPWRATTWTPANCMCTPPTVSRFPHSGMVNHCAAECPLQALICVLRLAVGL